MQPQRWFRFLNHLTLGLACSCLVFAEAPYLPGVYLLLPVAVVVLLAAWRTEGRWVLPVWGANVLGLGIVLGGAAWFGGLMLDKDSWFHRAPLPAGLVPPLGPVLLALLLVKVFRPRSPADFWLLQGIGLLQVGLACVLVIGSEFGGLLAAYLAAGLGCLAAHYLAAARAAPGQPWAVAGGGRPVRGFLPVFVLRWTPLVFLPALALFLLTPRGDRPAWEPEVQFGGSAAAHSQSGSHDTINLLETGAVDLSNEIAWTVQVTDATGRPRIDLPAEQRWRGWVVDTYEKGVWTAEQQLPRPSAGAPQKELPDFGANQLVFTFTLTPRQAGGVFLADPIHFGPRGRRLPALRLSPERRYALFSERAGTVLSVGYSPRQEYVYRQVVPAPVNADRSPAAHLPPSYIERLTRPPGPGLAEWTVGLLRRLEPQARYRLDGALPPPPPDRSARGFLLDPDQWERVARALTDYLAHSGEYTYTLELHRQDTSLDPTLDFLLNIKQGHCERYAGALALMLRSIGIPARIVKGFRGAEYQGEGVYLVRQSAAHSWVEALMPGRGEDGLDWLALDPTPEAAAAPPSFLLAHWWEVSLRNGQQFWRSLILDYNAEKQGDLVEHLIAKKGFRGWLQFGTLLVAGMVLALAVFLFRRYGWSMPRWFSALLFPAAFGPRSPMPFYQRLLTLLKRYAGMAPAVGQTPREFGTAAGEVLRHHPATAGQADLPRLLAEVLYRVRFGDQPLGEDESQVLHARLDELAAALRQAGGRV